MISAGELKDKIVIERPENVSNGSGGFETVYTPILNTFARVREKQPSTDLIASQQNIYNVVEFLMRYRPQTFIKIGDRVTWRGFTFTVANSMIVDALRTSITILATAEMETSER